MIPQTSLRLTREAVDERIDATQAEPDRKAKAKVHFHAANCACLLTLDRAAVEFFSYRHNGAKTQRGRGGKVALKAGKADLVRQNDLLLGAVFDPNGNPTHHRKCVMELFGVSSNRYSRLHGLAKLKHVTVAMPRADLRRRDLKFVRIPPQAYTGDGPIAWWEHLRDDDPVEIARRGRHGLEGRSSNRALPPEVVDHFKGFVTANSYPNGRRPDDSHKALFFFNAEFSAVERHGTAEVTGRGVTLLDAFNAAQAATGGTRISGTTMRTWLREFFPLHAIRPHATDYCDTCAELQTATRSARKSLERYKAGGSTEADALQQADAQLAELQERMATHQASYRAEREAYVQAQHTSAQQLRAIKIAPSEEARRAAEAAYVPVIAVDYMMEQLLPTFGFQAQPGPTYYLQKEVIHVFGAVRFTGDGKDDPNEDTEGSTIYFTSEKEDGTKTNDHLLTYLSKIVDGLPRACRRIILYGDNAATIKSQYAIAWMLEMVEVGRLDEIQFRFMVPGHTKFAPDRLFARYSREMGKKDRFHMSQLLEGARKVAKTVQEVTAAELRAWREALKTKYNDLPGIRELRYFRVTRVGDHAVLHVSESSAPAAIAAAKSRCMVKRGCEAVRVTPAGKQAKGLEPRKQADLDHMYLRYIDEEFWPPHVLVGVKRDRRPAI